MNARVKLERDAIGNAKQNTVLYLGSDCREIPISKDTRMGFSKEMVQAHNIEGMKAMARHTEIQEERRSMDVRAAEQGAALYDMLCWAASYCSTTEKASSKDTEEMRDLLAYIRTGQ